MGSNINHLTCVLSPVYPSNCILLYPHFYWLSPSKTQRKFNDMGLFVGYFTNSSLVPMAVFFCPPVPVIPRACSFQVRRWALRKALRVTRDDDGCWDRGTHRWLVIVLVSSHPFLSVFLVSRHPVWGFSGIIQYYSVWSTLKNLMQVRE